MGITLPYLGHGVGLRNKHFPEVLAGTARADWFEAISENFMLRGGRPLRVLDQARGLAPVALHGVSLSVGSVDPLSEAYLDELAALAARIEPAWISDHLCWGSVGGHYAHDLLPLPYTEEAVAHVVERIERIQERLGRQILIENVSSYLTYIQSAMPEWEFLAEVARRSDCGILLDVNNVYVSAMNHGFDPYAYVAGVPADRVGQIHLAGHSDHGTHLLDTHDAPVRAEVWALYRSVVARMGRVSTLIEWDEHIPEFPELLAEADRARMVEHDVLGHMLRLPDIQREFFRSIARTGDSGKGSSSTLISDIRGDRRLGATERLEVYARMYRARLIDALGEDYPRVAALVGPEVFSDVAEDYVRAHPSTHHSLRWFGRGFADFLAGCTDRSLPAFLGDLACLEWARLAVFDAADVELLDVEALRLMPPDAWGSLRLRLAPAVEILRADWPAHRIWEAGESGTPSPEWQREEIWLRVWRQGDKVYQASMDVVERTALAQVRVGGEFAELCSGLMAVVSEEEVARTAGALVLRWIEDGLLLGGQSCR